MENRLILFVVLALTAFPAMGYSALNLRHRQDEPVLVKILATYEKDGITWVNLLIPRNLSRERLIKMAHEIHEGDPTNSYRFFDDDAQFARFKAWDENYPNAAYPYPREWLSKHHIANLQKMTYDRAGPKWVLIAGDLATVIVDFGYATRPTPTVQPIPAKPTPTPAFFDPKGEVTSRFDRFENKTKVDLNNALVAGEHLNGLYLMAYGERGAGLRQPTVLIGIKSISALLRSAHGDSPSLYVIIDGHPSRLGSLLRIKDDELLGLLHVEMFALSIDYGLFKRLVEAQSVEMRFGAVEFKLESRHFDLLRDFDRRLFY